MEKDSLGLIETLGLVAAIEAADAGSKAANVCFRGCESARAGLITVIFTGDVAAVRAAVTAGAAAARQVGKVMSVHVIARPDRQLHVTPNGSKPATKTTRIPETPVLEEIVPEVPPAAVEVATEIEKAIAEEIVASTSEDAAAQTVAIVEEMPTKEETIVVEAIVTEAENRNDHAAVEEELEEAVVAAAVPVTRKKEKVRKPRSRRKS